MKIHLFYPELGAPTTYRVRHLVEQFHQQGHIVQSVAIDQIDGDGSSPDYDLLYLYRLPWSLKLNKLIQRAKQQGRAVIFDVDDYVWDADLRRHTYTDHFSLFELIDLLEQRDRFHLAMKQADGAVVSTPYLARLVKQQLQKPVFIHANAVSVEMVTQAEQLLRVSGRHETDRCYLGYFSGNKGHTIDFELIIPPLNAIMQNYPGVHLKIVGVLDIKISKFSPEVQSRLEFVKPVGWSELLPSLKTIDINLAPLVDNPFNQSKSNIKFLEAALVGVPTVASNLAPFLEIETGQTGFLANTEQEWYQILKYLVESPANRYRIGQAARAYVLAHHTTTVQAPHLTNLLKKVTTLKYAPNTKIKPENWWIILRWLPLTAPRRAYQAIMPLSTRLYLREQRQKLIAAIKSVKFSNSNSLV